jgi:hypothetical protein
VPFAAVSALATFGDHLERREDPFLTLQSLLWGIALTLLVLSCAARSPATQAQTLPPLGRSALVACLGVFALKACVAVAPFLRRLALRTPMPSLPGRLPSRTRAWPPAGQSPAPASKIARFLN